MEKIALFEDVDLVVINKPAGWVVNNAQTASAPSVQDWFGSQYLQGQKWPADWQAQIPADFSGEYGTPEEIFTERQGIVHRLDLETSGVLLLAKHPGSLVNLLSQFKQRLTKKTYLALCHGKFTRPAGKIDLPLGRSSHNRQTFAVQIDGREAVTQYLVQEFYPHFDHEKLRLATGEKNLAKKVRSYQGFSLVECQPLTGRTHQIRVHLAHEQHPIVGDQTYVGKKRAGLDQLWCPRQFLHAAKLEFFHPRTKYSQIFQAELATDLQHALKFLLNKG